MSAPVKLAISRPALISNRRRSIGIVTLASNARRLLCYYATAGSSISSRNLIAFLPSRGPTSEAEPFLLICRRREAEAVGSCTDAHRNLSKWKMI